MCFAMELFHLLLPNANLQTRAPVRDFEVTRGPQVCDVHVRVHVLAHILWQLQKSERFHAPTVGSPKSKVWLRALWNHSQQPGTKPVQRPSQPAAAG